MRLKVICEDRLGLTQELLDILASKQIDLRGIEIDTIGIIYLNVPDIDFNAFSSLMAEIRRIAGVKDVKKIQFMPMERHNTELLSLLNNVPDAVLSINLKGNIDTANYSALTLFHHTEESIIDQPISALLPYFHFSHWLEGDKTNQREHVVLNGLDYIMDIMPVYIGDESQERILASTMLMIQLKKDVAKTDETLPLDHPLGFEHFVGVSNKHNTLINQAKKLSVLNQPLLIEGETGTGKEMLAKACHHRSSRAKHPFLILSCASMPDDVAETELFGHAPGSFNHQQGHSGIFEQANGGTVFLDEIGEMSAHLQIKLLRFLQDGTFRRVGEQHEIHVDVRVIASTRYHLADLAKSGVFREDLYYRLNVLTLTIPPLRDRMSDIQPLLTLFIAKHSANMNIEKPKLSNSLIDQLSQYFWPGNMRQLENAVLRALTELSDDNTLHIEQFHLPTIEQRNTQHQTISLDGSLDDIMKTYEANVLEQLYQSYPSSRKLAHRLNVSHTSIANKLRDYGINKKGTAQLTD